MKKGKTLLVLVIAITGAFLFLWSSKTNLDGIADEWLTEHPIIRIEDSFVGKVKGINNPPRLRQSLTFVSVLFDGGKKGTLDTDGNAIGYSDVFVRDVLQNGSIVMKKGNSDTIKITYDGVIYSFLIDKDD